MAARLALCIGNSTYEDGTLAQLRTPASDVRALAAAFRDPAIGGFDDVIELIDESEANVRRAVGQFFTRRHPEDMLLFYFSGHGVKDDRGRLFLAVRDTHLANLKATGIASGFVVESMDECRSKRQILVLDCCNSGAFAIGTKGDATALTASTFEGAGYGRVVLTASDATQYALEGDRIIERADLSLFTHYLLEGLVAGAAAPAGEDVITLDAWYEYAYGQIVSRTPTQTPRKWVYGQQGSLVVARNPRPRAVTPDALAEELKASLRDSRPWVREGTVGELASLLRGGDRTQALAARAALGHLAGKDDSARVRAAARAALEGTGDPVRPVSGPAAVVPPVAWTAADRGAGGTREPAARSAAPAQTSGSGTTARPDAGTALVLPPWVPWVAACMVAVALGSTVSDLFARSVITRPRSFPLGARAVFALIDGITLGAVLWWPVRKRIGDLPFRDFVVATLAATAIRWILLWQSDGQVTLVGAGLGWIAGAIDGAIFGTAQWLVLRRHAKVSPLWIAGMAAGWWLAGLWFGLTAVSLALMRSSLSREILVALNGAMIGAALGAGSAWAWLRLRPLDTSTGARRT